MFSGKTVFSHRWRADSLLLVLLGLLIFPCQAEDGAGVEEVRMVKAIPAVDSLVQQPVRFLRLYFNKAPIVKGSEIILRRAEEEGGEKSPQALPIFGLHTMGQNDLMIPVGVKLDDGNYIVEWRGRFGEQEVSGQYRFRVQIKNF